MFSFVFILGTIVFRFNVFANRAYLHRCLEADLIYSAMVIHVGEDGTVKSGMVGPNKLGS